ncbi:DUF1496 domain-containing protein [Photobacterium toruni]|uniref:DUF1496 domain-containing protein n=1 Tax=Photobacterium toruni TaxID=1935446 RepID=A0A1T4QM39_9GAMM|nr:DUF1496 domain-containing protein [Photobacterium toruni]MEC6830872.1 DUF1496 domain-containing protein [Photobacterium toruni]SKA04823.1 hypothetical protein CZ814_01059 [Photobacterium toruni]
MRFLKRGWLVIIGIIGFVVISHAKQYSTENIAVIQPMTELQLNTLSQRYCLYAGEGYSLGAVITTGNIVLECIPAQEIELNGPLKWGVRQAVSTSVTAAKNK